MVLEGSLPSSQKPATGPCPEPDAFSPVSFRNKLLFFLRRGILSPSPNPQAGGPPLVGCQWLFIRSVRSYTPYLLTFFNTVGR
jgi:hypothetical protein